MLNPELAQIARDVITEMKEDGWLEDDIIYWSTCGALLKHCEAHNLIPEDMPQEYLAAIGALVKQVMQEQEPTLQRCPYWPVSSFLTIGYNITVRAL